MRSRLSFGWLAALCLVLMGFTRGEAQQNRKLMRIVSPEHRALLDGHPVEVVVELSAKAHPHTFRAWLNGQRVTDAFTIVNGICAAQLGTEDGLHVGPVAQNSNQWKINNLTTFVRGEKKRWDMDISIFGVEDVWLPGIALFNASPMDPATIDRIDPLGNLNPSGHTFPTGHIYFYLVNPDLDPAPPVYPLFSPGALTVTSVDAVEHVYAGFVDYDITFAGGTDIVVKLGHVSSLAAAVFGDVSSFDGWDLIEDYETGGERYRRYRKAYDMPVSGGETLGTVGGNPGQWALDVCVWDFSFTPDTLANPSRWENGSWYTHGVCALDYYEEGDVVDELKALLDRESYPGDEHYCGEVLQDIAGTAQGMWFLEGTVNTYPEDDHLALVRHNRRPVNMAFSVGKAVTTLGSGVYEFLPENAGLVNRSFDAVTPDGQIYAYAGPAFGPNHVVLLYMPDAETLWIEAVDAASLNLLNPATWAFAGAQTTFVR